PGGVQEAVMAPPPAAGALAVTVSLVFVAQLPVLVPALTEVGSEEHQSRGTLVTVTPWESTTVAVRLRLPPELTLKEVSVEPLIVRAIDCTAQVVTYTGALFALAALAKICVSPGT